MKVHPLFLTVCLAVISSSCGLITAGNDSDRESSSEDYEYTESSDEEQLYICPMCEGNKQIAHYYTGEIITCPACEGNGVVTQSTIEQLQEADRIGREWAEGFINGESGGYGQSRSADQIQAEIEQCETEINNLQSALESIDSGSTLYAYYSQELVALRTRLSQLQRELRYAE